MKPLAVAEVGRQSAARQPCGLAAPPGTTGRAAWSASMTRVRGAGYAGLRCGLNRRVRGHPSPACPRVLTCGGAVRHAYVRTLVWLSLARVAAASRGMAPPCTHGSAKDDPAHAGRRNPRVPPCSVSRAWLDAGPASVLSSCFCLFAHLFANFIDSLAMCPAGRPVPLGRTATPFYAR
jgi:hypothetical protein